MLFLRQVAKHLLMSPSVYINTFHESEKYQELWFNFRCAFSYTDM